MKKVTIYGERCSGTNYLEQLLLFNAQQVIKILNNSAYRNGPKGLIHS